VHTHDYIHFLKHVFSEWSKERPLALQPQAIAETFFVRSLARRKPRNLVACLGYYCFDRVTPILKNTFEVALESAFCAITGADLLLKKQTNNYPAVYALCRPPGHHAHADLAGGWCYLNNAAIAAKRLAEHDCNNRLRRVTVLDVDYHHGNGTQDIFYESPHVQYVSIHADPDNGGEPYFMGYGSEEGIGNGNGTTLNIPLPMFGVTDERYFTALDIAVAAVRKFAPEYLVVSFGLDTEENDGVGTWSLTPAAFDKMGVEIAKLGLPTLVVQEGGYNISKLGPQVVGFLSAFKPK